MIRDSKRPDRRRIGQTKTKDVDVFCCPPNTMKTGQKEFAGAITKWLKEKCESNVKKWWTKIELCGSIAPFCCSKRFDNLNEQDALQRRRKIIVFQKLLEKEFKFDNYTVEKDKVFPFAQLWNRYCQEKKKSPERQDKKEMKKILLSASRESVHPFLKLFIFYCLPLCEKERDLWLNSEYFYVLDNLCDNYNRYNLHQVIDNINQLKEQTRVKLENKQTKHELAQQHEMIRAATITSSDFVQNCVCLLNLVTNYKSTFKTYNLVMKEITMLNLSQFEHAMINFSSHLFLSGTPLEFTNGIYSRLENDFTRQIFGDPLQLEMNDKKQLLSIAIAGPQSSGKSTLLRRMFGIDCKAGAARTTKGINFSRISTVEKEVVLIDTEGINSVEESSVLANAGEEKKRNNKIILEQQQKRCIFIHRARIRCICSIYKYLNVLE